MNSEPNQSHPGRAVAILLSTVLSAGLILLFLSSAYAQTPGGGTPAPSDQCPDIVISNIAGAGADKNETLSISAAKSNALSNCIIEANKKTCKPTNKCGKTGTNPGTITASKPQLVSSIYYTAAVASCTVICDPLE